jgi:glycerol-3-phosphate acyltransferase PlsY
MPHSSQSIVTLILLAFLGYLCGSLPFAVWITRLVKGVDVRAGGSGHATATNTLRQAGWEAAVLVLGLDLGKGFLPIYLGVRIGAPNWVLGLTAALTVAGHCWPLFAGWRGGMGLATSGGAIFAAAPLGFALGLGVLVFAVLLIRHSARGAVVAGLLIPGFLWMFGLRGAVIWVSGGAGLLIVMRFWSDWHRRYRELWLDREKRVTA